MTEPTTREERAKFLHPAKYTAGHIIPRLITDLERAEAKVARLEEALNDIRTMADAKDDAARAALKGTKP